jgi:hypothetical protein
VVNPDAWPECVKIGRGCALALARRTFALRAERVERRLALTLHRGRAFAWLLGVRHPRCLSSSESWPPRMRFYRDVTCRSAAK